MLFELIFVQIAALMRVEVRVLGVDDWAWRKGLRYGTMLMDMEERKIVDLLPDCSTESFAQWLHLQARSPRVPR